MPAGMCCWHLVLGTDPLQPGAHTVSEANHQDPVMTYHLPGGEPGSIVKVDGREIPNQVDFLRGNYVTEGGSR